MDLLANPGLNELFLGGTHTAAHAARRHEKHLQDLAQSQAVSYAQRAMGDEAYQRISESAEEHPYNIDKLNYENTTGRELTEAQAHTQIKFNKAQAEKLERELDITKFEQIHKQMNGVITSAYSLALAGYDGIRINTSLRNQFLDIYTLGEVKPDDRESYLYWVKRNPEQASKLTLRMEELDRAFSQPIPELGGIALKDASPQQLVKFIPKYLEAMMRITPEYMLQVGTEAVKAKFGGNSGAKMSMDQLLASKMVGKSAQEIADMKARMSASSLPTSKEEFVTLSDGRVIPFKRTETSREQQTQSGSAGAAIPYQQILR